MPRKKVSDLERVAREQLGFQRLRPGQEEAVRSLLSGRDTVVVQPTGSGKSAIYQTAGLLLEGATIVVSPLIALQKDQADAIEAQPHDAETALINSSQPAAKTREAFEKVVDGDVEFIFLAPEQLRKQKTLDKLKESEPSLFVIDEAHCVSEWGHDFRPDYLTLGKALDFLGRPTVLAMTATATLDVRDEIIERLSLKDPAIFVRGFDRPNIHLRVDHVQTEEEKLEALIKRVRWADKPGIVYAGTRKNAEAVVSSLQEQGIGAVLYHAGLKAAEREAVQERFMTDAAEVIVATNAFGMGIDKAGVRFVYHFDICDSLDSYYQEIGRAGRDDEPAEAVLFYRPQNLGLRKFQSAAGKLETHNIEQVAGIIDRQSGPIDPAEIGEQLDLSARKVTSMINRLEEAGAIQLKEDGNVKLADGIEPAEAAKAAADAQGRLKGVKLDRLEQMQRYAEMSGCRREFLLRYFDDPFTGPCGNCDNDGPVQAANIGTRREVAPE